MVYSEYTKLRIIQFYKKGLKAYSIAIKLEAEGLSVSRRGIAKLLDRYKERGTTDRKRGSGRPSSLSESTRQLIEEQMRADDETTAIQLYRLLRDKQIDVSLSTILRGRKALGWTFRGSAYCQLIRDANKVKRLDWAKKHMEDNFHSVVWTDECSIQMESHRRHSCRKIGEPPRNKPRSDTINLFHNYTYHLLCSVPYFINQFVIIYHWL